MRPRRIASLRDRMVARADRPESFVADAQMRLAVHEVADGSGLGRPLEEFRDQSVMLSTARQMPTICALAALDGIAARLVIRPPGITRNQLTQAATDAACEIILTDGDMSEFGQLRAELVACSDRLDAMSDAIARDVDTEWVLFTSGSTGSPKLAMHTFSSLSGPLADAVAGDHKVWSTFYDVRRYGGLQILIRALVGGGSLVLSGDGEPASDFLARAGRSGVTHISGTPTHWRRALMSDALSKMSPRYLRLSGEAADQAILDGLRRTFPDAEIAHAFASTEAGIAFDVRDGRAGFPVSLIGYRGEGVDLAIEDGSLRIRSPRAATGYLGADMPKLADERGFVDTGDLIEIRDGRCFFSGRRGGVINVGGRKVSPETVEAVINQHEAVLMSRVSGRRSPITGALVIAEYVLKDIHVGVLDPAAISDEVRHLCRRSLAAHEVPAIIEQVACLGIAPSGKMERALA